MFLFPWVLYSGIMTAWHPFLALQLVPMSSQSLFGLPQPFSQLLRLDGKLCRRFWSLNWSCAGGFEASSCAGGFEASSCAGAFEAWIEVVPEVFKLCRRPKTGMRGFPPPPKTCLSKLSSLWWWNNYWPLNILIYAFWRHNSSAMCICDFLS